MASRVLIANDLPPLRNDLPRHPELDSLRAFAILGVMYTHFVNDDSMLGTLAVDLFFVLSGYLITGILLRCRTFIEAGESSVPAILRTFYLRRCLRILPVYYLCLFGLVLAGSQEVRDHVWWHATFNSNLLFVFKPFSEFTAHFWTLAVEEQFYLIWPVIILFTPRSKLLAVLLTVIACGPAYRLAGYAAGWSRNAMCILMPGSLDILAIGALLAHVDVEKRWRPNLLRAGLCSTPVPLLLAAFPFFQATHLYILERTFCALAFAWLISTSIGGAHSAAKGLRLRVLVNVGVVSYGAYVFHLVGGRLAAKTYAYLWGRELDRGLLLFILGTAMTLAIAAGSWKLVEQPINSLKRFLPYRSARERVSQLS